MIARDLVAAGLVRFVAVIVLVAGGAKLADVLVAGEPNTVVYAPVVLVALGVAEIGLAGWAVWRPRSWLAALALAGFVLAVTGYLLLVPPGELERYGCQCFGTRFRFQDVRDHLRFNGVLIVLAVVGAWLARNTSAPSSSDRAG